jgi:putative chitinase
MTETQLQLIMPTATPENVARYLQPINDVFLKYGMGTSLRIAHFLAQIGEESMSLRYTEELADGSAYEGRKDLGNIVTGDGKRFKGRGVIQITGRTNYQLYGKFAEMDFTQQPELLATTPYCIDSAGWFWQIHGLNTLADIDNILAITKRINGGVAGLPDRKARLHIAKEVLGIANSPNLPNK